MTKAPGFNPQKLEAARVRARRIAMRLGGLHHGFLHQQAAQVLAERLSATKRVFKSPAILFDSPFSELIENTIRQGNPSIKSPFRMIPAPGIANPLLQAEPESLDLAVSVFDLHHINDLPAMMMQINLALKPDGLLLAVLPSAGTLQELAASMMQAELEIRDGAAMRIDLFPEIRQFGDLLQKTGFKLPVCDIEERIIRYGAFSGLLNDLRGAGASLVANDRGDDSKSHVLSSAARNRIEEIYFEKFADADGKIRATFNMAFMSGWKDDASQQKPLRPGSAKHHLKDFLG